MSVSRRSILMGVGSVGLAYGLSAGRSSASTATGAPEYRAAALRSALGRPDTLAYSAAKLGILFGTEIGRGFFADPTYVDAVRHECSVICATLLSAGATRRSQSGFEFKLGDQQVAFAHENQLAVDAGYLVVHGDEPKWIVPGTARADALDELERIVTTTMTRYEGRIDHWIVVNEAISPKGLRPCTWLSTIGDDYIAEALKAARRADPNAMLVINENNLEDEAGGDKRRVMLDLLTKLCRAGVPLDALGMQAHLRPDRQIDRPALESFLHSVSSLGLRVVVTEMDVLDVSLPADTSARDAATASTMANFLNIVLSNATVTSISVWGLSDKYSWYNSPGIVSYLRRSDGIASRPTLLDQDMHRKPAYYSVRAAFDRAARG